MSAVVFPPPDRVREVWIIRESALGDVILSEPSISAVAALYPDAHVRVVTRPKYFPLYEHHPRVHEAMTVGEARARPGPDLIVDLQNRLRTVRLAYRGRNRIIWRKRTFVDLLRAIRGLPLHQTYWNGPHQLDRIARGLGLSTSPRPRIWLCGAWRSAARREVREVFGASSVHPDRRPSLVVLLPAASRPVKAWPWGKFAAVGRALMAQGVSVAVVGGPGEEAWVEKVAGGSGGYAWRSETHLGLVAGFLEQAAVVMGNDTGLLHLAAAVGRPVVGVYGPTPPGRWRPAADLGSVVSLAMPCAPCSDHGARPCARGDQACLRRLEVEPVVEAVRSVLHNRQAEFVLREVQKKKLQG